VSAVVCKRTAADVALCANVAWCCTGRPLLDVVTSYDR
jgi:hypothetical protein